MSNKIHQQLPQAYHEIGEQREIAIALTQGSAEKLAELLSLLTVEGYRSQFLNPATAREEWLDAIAEQQGWGDYWDSTYDPTIKRALLIEAKWLFDNRGTKKAFERYMEILGYDVRLRSQAGFIVGASFLPANLGGDPFAIDCVLPPTFIESSPERARVKRVASQFLPCWVEINYVF